MNLIVFGGDMRMEGAALAARRAGWTALHVKSEKDAEQIPHADAVMLPWPRSFTEGKLTGGEMSRERTLALLPPCSVIVHGQDMAQEEMPMADSCLNPERDEAFLTVNAELTAEGAVCRAMQRQGRALMGATSVITGFGRIGCALAKRLTALEMFVIVCARNERQMQEAHAMGAHPMPLDRLKLAAAQADILFNTVPAPILDEEVLKAIGKEALVIDLASAPYGAKLELAKELGVSLIREGGLPGRYAPLDAGAALFDALQRSPALLTRMEGGVKNG